MIIVEFFNPSKALRGFCEGLLQLRASPAGLWITP